MGNSRKTSAANEINELARRWALWAIWAIGFYTASPHRCTAT